MSAGRLAVPLLLAALLAGCSSSESTGPGSGGVSVFPNPPGPAWSGTATAVTVGERANCVLQTDGTPWCWGSTRGFGLRIDIGLRGVPNTVNADAVLDSICQANTPVGQMPGWPCNVLHPVRVGTKAFATLRLSPWDAPLCGVDAAGGAYCWDDAAYQDIQADSTAGGLRYCGDAWCGYSPQRVRAGQPLRQYTPLSIGLAGCAVALAGTVLCWGNNYYNLLGNRSINFTSDTLVPVLGAPAATATAVAPNAEFACALATNAKAWCWGDNGYGQVGINVFGGRIATPTQVTSTQNFTAVAAALAAACALNSTGQAYCWGDGRQGQIGWNGVGWSLVPYAVTGGRSFTQITAGNGHFCALEASGAAWCWGDNFYGQLGIDRVASPTCGGGPCSSVPVAVQGGHAFRQISAGTAQTCGVTTSNEVWCWGWGAYGRLGPWTLGTEFTATPVKITP